MRRWGSPRSATALVAARGLVKRFGDFVAVDGIDFEINAGESFGFLGPNGAGKTSTMKMISCISPATRGRADGARHGPRSARARRSARASASCPRRTRSSSSCRRWTTSSCTAATSTCPRAEIKRRALNLLEFTQLAERANDKADNFSGGMKRRLTIARSLISEPDVLILDEPTTGLDPQARHLVWERLYRLKSEGVTLVITTHYMDEAEQLCDRLVVMDRGKIVAHGTPRELIERHSTREVLELRFGLNGHGPHADVVAGLADRVEELPDRLLLYVHDGDEALAAVHAKGLAPESALVRRSTLEDVFLRLTGRTLVD